MADYWKSQARKFCDFCKCWIADNKPSIEFHEGGKKHKENVSKRLKEIHKNSAKQAKQQKKYENDMEKMEQAAMAAYLKDVESNTRDMTADKIIQEKWKNKEEKKEELKNPNSIPDTEPGAHPRFKEPIYRHSFTAADIDPFDPFAAQKLARLAVKQAKVKKELAKNTENCKEKGKVEKGKGKASKSKDEPSGSKIPIRKVWYEVRSKKYSYYWNTETNETVWEPPEEGFMSLAEQAEEEKEKAIQEEFLEQIDKEGEEEKKEILEEQRACAERERLKEIRKQFNEKKKSELKSEGSEDITVESDEEKIPYRRDYSVPEKPQPYGSWQVVRRIEQPKIDLQLPQVKKESIVPTISFEKPPVEKVFKEKTITCISTGDSDDEDRTISFKKRKFGSKNVRQRMVDD